MRAAADFLLAIGTTEAQLWVLAGNRRARRFYEFLGWAWDGRTRTKPLEGPLAHVQFADQVDEACYRRSI